MPSRRHPPHQQRLATVGATAAEAAVAVTDCRASAIVFSRRAAIRLSLGGQ